MLDVLVIVLLLFFSAQAVFYALLAGPGYWGPTVGLLLNAGGAGTILYILSAHGSAGRTLSTILLAFGWLLGLFAVVLGFAPGEFSELGVLLPKVIIFLYPLVFLVGVLVRGFGSVVFKSAVMLYTGVTLGQIVLLFSAGGILIPMNGIGLIVLVFLGVWLFSLLYPLYRLLAVDGLL